MTMFPILKTGAVAQYPATRTLQFSTKVLRFVDGSEQRFREFKRPLRRWVIRLDLLDEAELAGIEEFFQWQQGRAGSFLFTDPWDGTPYPNCSFDQDGLDAHLQSPDRGSTLLIVRENAD